MAVERSVSKRVIYFDILRVVAIFAVVAVHLSAQHWLDVDVSSRAWFAFNLYCTTGKWSVPIFVMISGALFLGRDTTIRTILKKNVLRMAGVFVFWSAATHSSASFFAAARSLMSFRNSSQDIITCGSST